MKQLTLAQSGKEEENYENMPATVDSDPDDDDEDVQDVRRLEPPVPQPQAPPPRLEPPVSQPQAPPQTHWPSNNLQRHQWGPVDRTPTQAVRAALLDRKSGNCLADNPLGGELF